MPGTYPRPYIEDLFFRKKKLTKEEVREVLDWWKNKIAPFFKRYTTSTLGRVAFANRSSDQPLVHSVQDDNPIVKGMSLMTEGLFFRHEPSVKSNKGTNPYFFIWGFNRDEKWLVAHVTMEVDESTWYRKAIVVWTELRDDPVELLEWVGLSPAHALEYLLHEFREWKSRAEQRFRLVTDIEDQLSTCLGFFQLVQK